MEYWGNIRAGNCRQSALENAGAVANQQCQLWLRDVFYLGAWYLEWVVFCGLCQQVVGGWKQVTDGS